MSSLDLQRFRCFLAVVEEKNFGRAAQRLNITAAPLSRQIRRLENELGGDLFVRAYHDVELTPLGSSLLGPIRATVAAADAVWAAAERLRTTGAPLRVGATPYAPSPVLDSFLEVLKQGNFPIENEVLIGPGSNELARQLKAGALDLALVHLPAAEGLDALQWTSYKLSVAVRSDDELAIRNSLTLSDLSGRRIIHPLARLLPKVWEEHKVQLHSAGVINIDNSEVLGIAEIATHVWSRRLVSFVPDVPGSVLSRVFAAPQFTVIPVTGESLIMKTGILWSPGQAQKSPLLQRALMALRDVDLQV